MGQADISYGSGGHFLWVNGSGPDGYPPSQRYTYTAAALLLGTSQRGRLLLLLFWVGKQTEFYGSHSRLSTV